MLYDTSIETPAPTRVTPDEPDTAANMAKWLAALRSGRYAQTTGQLRRDDSYCCLGVACEVSGLGEWVIGEHNTRYRVGDFSPGGHLPPPVWAWLGLKDGAGSHGPHGRKLTEINDSGEHDFAAIADLIETIDAKGLWSLATGAGQQ